MELWEANQRALRQPRNSHQLKRQWEGLGLAELRDWSPQEIQPYPKMVTRQRQRKQSILAPPMFLSSSFFASLSYWWNELSWQGSLGKAECASPLHSDSEQKRKREEWHFELLTHKVRPIRILKIYLSKNLFKHGSSKQEVFWSALTKLGKNCYREKAETV